MADNKKSVLLYCDIIHTVEELENEDAGLLFKHYLRYINDKNPEPPSKLIKIVFEPIKQNLKRDLKKWDATKKTKSESGLLGNLKRWNKDLYDMVISSEIELEKAVAIAKDRTLSQTVANIAVKDTVTVTVNDKVKEMERNKDPLYFLTEKLFDVLAKESSWHVSVYRDHKIKTGTLSKWLEKFTHKLSSEGVQGKTISDAKSHFSRWLKIELKKPENKTLAETDHKPQPVKTILPKE